MKPAAMASSIAARIPPRLTPAFVVSLEYETRTFCSIGLRLRVPYLGIWCRVRSSSGQTGDELAGGQSPREPLCDLVPRTDLLVLDGEFLEEFRFPLLTAFNFFFLFPLKSSNSLL